MRTFRGQNLIGFPVIVAKINESAISGILDQQRNRRQATGKERAT
jgi:hypothetical protein